MFRFIKSWLWGTDTELTVDQCYEILEKKRDVDEVEEEPKEQTNEIERFDENLCFRRTGIITGKKDGVYEIDDLYEFKSERDIDVGAQVCFTLYTTEKDVKISDVTIQDEWTNLPANEESSWCVRSLICKVQKREGRKITVSPHDITVDLDTVSSEFIPIVGDWVDLEAKVEIDPNVTDLSGEVLEVEKIRPLRPRVLQGSIREWDDLRKTGIIDRIVFFNEEALCAGYMPFVGDKVTTEVIESDQGRYMLRSLKIIPEKQADLNLSLNEAALPEFEIEKDGIFVSRDVFIKAKKMGERHQFELLIKNTSEEDLVLSSVSLPSSNSVCKILKPDFLDKITILPGKSIKFEGECVIKNMGTLRELVLFSFVNCVIGRWITTSLESKHENHYQKEKILQTTRSPFARNENNFVKGERPHNAPRFISARLPEYRVPEKLLEIVTKHSENTNSSELMEKLRLIKPSLAAALSFNNYEERFHTLLYLEEIHELLAIQSYAQDQACFIVDGEYMVLEIENLSEKRPSLMIGDRIIARDAYNENATQMEGYIHKIGAKHVYIKFSRGFHDRYRGEDMSIIAVASRTSYRRMHQAIGLAVRNLRDQFLFPSKVPYKNPQIQFSYDPYDDSIHTVHKKIKNLQFVNNSRTTDKSRNGETKNSAELNQKTRRKEEIFNSLQKHSLNNRTSLNKCEEPGIENARLNNQVTDLEAKKDVAVKQPQPEKALTRSQLLLDKIQKQQQKNVHTKNNEDPKNGIIKSFAPFKLEWFNDSLNYYQKEAVRNILIGEARPMPYFIFGPPGTGKTVTLVETILQLLRLMPHSRLLVAAPSNSAADLIAVRLIDSGVLQPGDLIRLVAYRCIMEDTLPVKLVPYCATADIAREGTHSNINKVNDKGLTVGCNSSVIGRHRITIGTCSALGILYNLGFPKGHFTHIIVDEAGQATEPEVMIPMTLMDISSGQVILAGDPLQLGPIVISKAACKYGLQETYLDRMLSRFPYVRDPEGFSTTNGYDPRLITRLVYNYRSLPGILELTNKIFYNRQLIATISAEDSEEANLLKQVEEILPEHKNGIRPAVVFHGVIGQNYQTPDCPSWFNPNEASQIFFYVNELYRLGLKSTDIGIISPYIKQVRQIRALLIEAEYDIPKIGTVEEFQGQEFNVILMSTVRSSSKDFVAHDLKYKLGFLSNPRRVNVAITRAQALMVIVGNPQLLLNDPHWRSVIRHCVDNRAYRGCSLPSQN